MAQQRTSTVLIQDDGIRLVKVQHTCDGSPEYAVDIRRTDSMGERYWDLVSIKSTAEVHCVPLRIDEHGWDPFYWLCSHLDLLATAHLKLINVAAMTIKWP